MPHDPVVIASIARTPIGQLLGGLKSFSAWQLGQHAIAGALNRAALAPTEVDEVLMGCVLPAGVGQAPARQAAIAAGLPVNTPCTTVNKVCGSGMKTVMLAHDAIALGTIKLAIAGGMESMTNAPYLLMKARGGYRFGHETLYDHMVLDGLEDAYDKGKVMGTFAETCAKAFHISREAQDAFAIESFARAQLATEKKYFTAEIVPLTLQTKQGHVRITNDERPFAFNLERLPHLPTAYAKDGTITAGNASSIADGAAAVTLLRLSEATRRGLKPLAQIVGHATCAKKPSEFTTAPIDVTRKLLQQINWPIESVDLFEVNEAFAVVAIVFANELAIPLSKINIHGGACALGHPIGATGARVIVTLLAALQQYQLQRGIATVCIGGGEATALAVEML